VLTLAEIDKLENLVGEGLALLENEKVGVELRDCVTGGDKDGDSVFAPHLLPLFVAVGQQEGEIEPERVLVSECVWVLLCVTVPDLLNEGVRLEVFNEEREEEKVDDGEKLVDRDTVGEGVKLTEFVGERDNDREGVPLMDCVGERDTEMEGVGLLECVGDLVLEIISVLVT